MKIQNSDTKVHLIQRLRRIEGQIRGVQGMIDAERDCQEIIQQLSAIRSALQGTSRFFLQEYATACLLDVDRKDSDPTGVEAQSKRKKIIHDMLDLLDKAP